MSNETKKYAGLESLRAFLDGCRTLFASITHKHTMSDIADYTVDSELSSTSNNPVQNSVLTAELDAIKDAKADWNENDETKVGYIKNRTHYEEIGSEVLVETTIDIDEDGGCEDIDISELEVGKLYTVTLNGTVYECVAWYHNDWDSICIGNGSMCEAEGFGGDEPFYIESWETDGEYYVVFNAETAGTYTIKIECVANIIHKLDEKFISYKPGLRVEGKEFTINEETVVAKEGAEIFNSFSNKATGYYSHAEGQYTTASGIRSHAEGEGTTASSQDAHAEGFRTIASGSFSHAEGDHTTASGFISHAEGCETTASGSISHAEGCETTASGGYSHAEGYNTIASSQSQHVQGKYNIEDTEDKYAHIVGNGTYRTRSNAHTLDWNGNAWYSGTVKLGGSSYDDASEVALKSDIKNIDLSSYETTTDAQTKYDNAVAHSDANLETAKNYADTVASGKSDINHNHDGRYYTESEIDVKLSSKTSIVVSDTEPTDDTDFWLKKY